VLKHCEEPGTKYAYWFSQLDCQLANTWNGAKAKTLLDLRPHIF